MFLFLFVCLFSYFLEISKKKNLTFKSPSISLPLSRYETVTREELEESGEICTICRDEMKEAKRLPCKHMFHEFVFFFLLFFFLFFFFFFSLYCLYLDLLLIIYLDVLYI